MTTKPNQPSEGVPCYLTPEKNPDYVTWVNVEFDPDLPNGKAFTFAQIAAMQKKHEEDVQDAYSVGWNTSMLSSAPFDGAERFRQFENYLERRKS